MQRCLMVCCLSFCLIANGCKTAAPREITADNAQPVDFNTPREQTKFAHWLNTHPILAGALAVGAVVGVSVLAGFLIYDEARHGRAEPLPWPQVGP